MRRCVVGAVWLLSLPATAAAQKDVFVDAFIALHSALPGTFGDEGPQVISELSRLTAALAAWDRAAAAAETALKKRAATPGEFALHYVDHQRFEAAIEAMNAAIAAEPARGSLYIFQGQLFEATGRRAEARAAFARARQLDPDDPVAAYLMATQSTRDAPADLPPLVATLIAATDRPPTLSQPFADLRLVPDLAARTPRFAPAAYVSAFTAFAARRFRDAVDEFRMAIVRDPLIADPATQSRDLLAGAAALRDGKGDEAVLLLEAAVKAEPESSESRRALGIAYRARGRLDEAIAQFESAVRLRPGDERSRVALGSTLAEAGKLEDAERELRAAIRTLPKSGDARWALVEVLERQSRGIEAIALLDEAAALPVVAGRMHLLRRLAEITHLYTRDLERVVSLVSQIVRLAPNEANGHRDLGLAYYRAGRDDEAALELLMLALLRHEDAETLGALGQIHFNAGRFERAESALRRAVALDPARAQVHYVLAQTLQRLGRHSEAAEQLVEFDKLRAAAFNEQRRRFERANSASGPVAR